MNANLVFSSDCWVLLLLHLELKSCWFLPYQPSSHYFAFSLLRFELRHWSFLFHLWQKYPNHLSQKSCFQQWLLAIHLSIKRLWYLAKLDKIHCYTDYYTIWRNVFNIVIPLIVPWLGSLVAALLGTEFPFTVPLFELSVTKSPIPVPLFMITVTGLLAIEYILVIETSPSFSDSVNLISLESPIQTRFCDLDYY